MTSITNEINRLAVEFASFVRQQHGVNLYPFGAETQLLLAEDEDANGAKVWALIHEPSWQYSNVGALCHDRACRAESGELLLQGKRVQAEAYLGAWRKALDRPISFAEMLAMGFSLTVSIALPAPLCAHPKDRDLAKLAKHMDSPHIASRDAERIVWRITLTDAASILMCNDLRSIYWSREQYSGDFRPVWEVARATPAPRCADLDLQEELPVLFKEFA